MPRCVNSEYVVEVWAYEASRLFRDRLVDADSVNRFDNILLSVARGDWSVNIFDNLQGTCLIQQSQMVHFGFPPTTGLKSYYDTITN